jgi:AcrR family transcriptional regulator
LARLTQEDRSRATRTALVSTARRLFAERGYADVSAAEIVTAAGLSRGALYHHYTDKADLFKAVLLEMEVELTDELRSVLAQVDDPTVGMAVGLDAFLASCERDEVVRIMLTDAPSVLGWREWRRIETEHGLGLMTELLESAMDAGTMVRQPVKALAQLLLSAIIEAALLVADAGPDTRPAVREEVRQGLVALFTGLSV